jgi:hypothetical protein
MMLAVGKVIRRLTTPGRTGPWAVATAVLAACVSVSAQVSEPNRTSPPPVNGACGNCHTCERPTPENQCLRTCARSEAIRLAKEFAAKHGPRIVILDELENMYLPVPFDHAGHAAMAQMAGGCATCHHFTPEGTEHPACKTCHDIQPGRGDIKKPGLKGAYHRQCMSCHREWSGETGCGVCHHPKAGAAAKGAPVAVPTPGDLIGQMHPPIPEPEEELYTTKGKDDMVTKVLFRHKEHIKRYDLRCAECHREDNCNRCHQEGREHVQQVRTFEQHHKPCLACHRNYSCERCHFAESASPPPSFDHANTGWPLTRYHRDKSCRVCHPTAPFAKVDRECNSCHANWTPVNFNHAVTGQKLNENHARVDCEECHKGRKFGGAPACEGCHDESEGITFPAKRPGPKETTPG